MVKTKTSFIRIGNKIIVETSPAIAKDRLEAGTYSLLYDPYKGTFAFEEINFKNDSILPLPSPEFEKVINQMSMFMSPEVKTKFKDFGYLYKRGILLHGNPGTGKTIITTRITEKAVQDYNAICLFVENINALKKAYEFLNESQPEQLLVVVFEEFDRLAEDSEEDLLLLLDGQIQRDSVIFLATTNNLNKIPPRLYRPGRMSSVIEVNYPTDNVRRAYFENKLGKNFKHLTEWIEKTEGLSVDELKEIVQAVYILNENIDETIQRLVETRSEKDYEKNEQEEINYLSYLKSEKRRK